MTSERIKEIQEATAYPNSTSVMLALKQVWNECEQAKKHNDMTPEEFLKERWFTSKDGRLDFDYEENKHETEFSYKNVLMLLDEFKKL